MPPSMPTFDRIADLPLEIEDYDLEGLVAQVSSEFERKSTIIRLRGDGQEGLGEDVTYDAVDHEILQAEGYITGWSVEDAKVGKNLTIQLKYGPNRERSLAGVRRVSKPGLRKYVKSTELPKVLGGLGVAILSTPKGVMTGQRARQLGVGGEVICKVW